jgi:hypothetical protein
MGRLFDEVVSFYLFILIVDSGAFGAIFQRPILCFYKGWSGDD